MVNNKLSDKQKGEIKKRFFEGEKTSVLAEEFGIAKNTVYYHTSEKVRKKMIKAKVEYFKNLGNEKKKSVYKNRREYLRKYMKKRYSEDPVFRKKHIERVKDWQKRSKRNKGRIKK